MGLAAAGARQRSTPLTPHHPSAATGHCSLPSPHCHPLPPPAGMGLGWAGAACLVALPPANWSFHSSVDLLIMLLLYRITNTKLIGYTYMIMFSLQIIPRYKLLPCRVFLQIRVRDKVSPIFMKWINRRINFTWMLKSEQNCNSGLYANTQKKLTSICQTNAYSPRMTS